MARIYWFVVVANGNWAVKREAGPALQTFQLQSAAIDYAATQARTYHQTSGQPTGIRVQGEDGKWRDERTYGDDPFPPAG